MSRLVGKISSRRYEPVIYFILISDYLYVGETQSHPVIRWGDHLASGTLLDKLDVLDRKALLLNKDIEFTAFSCDYIKNHVPDLNRSYALKYTEYWIHVFLKTKVNSVKDVLGRDYQLISDVPNTPKFFQDDNCKCLAVDIFDEFLIKYKTVPD